MVAAGAWRELRWKEGTGEQPGRAGRERAGLRGELTICREKGLSARGQVGSTPGLPSCRAVGGARLAHLEAWQGRAGTWQGRGRDGQGH